MVINRTFQGIVSYLAILLWVCLYAPLASAHEDEAPDMDIRDFVRNAEFVFKGRVEQIDYRISEPITVIDPTTGEPGFADGSNLPHAFTRFSIERIYKGKAPEGGIGGPATDVTLRFIGGPADDDPGTVLFVDTYPFFDVGDRAVLFVQRNEFKPCPLYRGGYGRLWLLPDPDVTGGTDLVFNNYGHELVFVAGSTVPPLVPDEVAFGPFHNLQPINTHTIGTVELERVFVDPNNESSLPGAEPPIPVIPKGPQLDELSFDALLDQIVSEVHTRAELAELPPINSANPDAPFFAEGFSDDEPNDYGPEPANDPARDWLNNIDPARRDAILEGTYKVQFTFENNGYYDKSGIDAAWYISTNSNITTSDNRIKTKTMTLNRNKVYTAEHTVTIPSSGYEVDDELYLGVIVDYTGKMSEFSSFNNATYLPILIVD